MNQLKRRQVTWKMFFQNLPPTPSINPLRDVNVTLPSFFMFCAFYIRLLMGTSCQQMKGESHLKEKLWHDTCH